MNSTFVCPKREKYIRIEWIEKIFLKCIKFTLFLSHWPMRTRGTLIDRQ